MNIEITKQNISEYLSLDKINISNNYIIIIDPTTTTVESQDEDGNIIITTTSTENTQTEDVEYYDLFNKFIDLFSNMVIYTSPICTDNDGSQYLTKTSDSIDAYLKEIWHFHLDGRERKGTMQFLIIKK